MIGAWGSAILMISLGMGSIETEEQLVFFLKNK
jgi:hypothetical protein